MNNMAPTITPKSDQLNSDDLIAGARTITIREVRIAPGTEQPVSVYFHGDNGKPYLPCKSMRRVMVELWGPDAGQYAGRSMTLYRDPSVTWGGMEVGGIRISHMSHIEKATMVVLTATKKTRKPFHISPLASPPEPINTEPPEPKKRTWATLLADIQTKAAACSSMDDALDLANDQDVKSALAKGSQSIKDEVNGMLTTAYGRYADAAVEAEMGAANEPVPEDAQ